MSDDVIRKYQSLNLLELQTTSVALTDKSFKVIWFNQSFKKDIGTGKVKGVTLKTLFGIDPPSDNLKYESTKSYAVPVSEKNKNLIITPLFNKSKKDIEAYFVELTPIVVADLNQTEAQEKLRRNLFFQSELQSILFLLLKEKSIDTIAEEILNRSINVTGSDFGLIVFHDGEEIKRFLYSFDPSLEESKDEVEKSIKFNSSFINKWLEINKRPLLALNHHNNIGYGLTQVFNCESLTISPCYFDNVLQAKIFVGKRYGSYSFLDINDLDQFSILLSFAISNIQTRELNTALESRLLQAQ